MAKCVIERRILRSSPQYLNTARYGLIRVGDVLCHCEQYQCKVTQIVSKKVVVAQREDGSEVKFSPLDFDCGIVWPKQTKQKGTDELQKMAEGLREAYRQTGMNSACGDAPNNGEVKRLRKRAKKFSRKQAKAQLNKEHREVERRLNEWGQSKRNLPQSSTRKAVSRKSLGDEGESRYRPEFSESQEKTCLQCAYRNNLDHCNAWKVCDDWTPLRMG